jgi:alpha-L-fucosidase
MKKIIYLALTALVTLSFTGNNQTKKYHQESTDTYQQRMKWFKEAKYGMFIHFGLYSQLGGVWKGDTVWKYSEWIKSYKSIPGEEYEPLINTFNPTDFDAELIATTAKKAGMKYLVITTKHHEGFCLWDSRYTDYDVASTPFDRDILKELSDACRKRGIRFGTYYSILDWHHPSQYPNMDQEDHWPRWGKNSIHEDKKDEYIQYMKNQLKELVDNYDTDIIWFDGSWPDWWTMDDGIDLYNYVRSLKPGIIINNRVAKKEDFKRDFGTPEQEHLDTIVDYEWEACYTLNNSWGFKYGDENWKEPRKIYDMLLDINNKGGNFLLNIGPDGQGNVPQKSIDILLEVGRLLKSEKN